MAALAIDWSSYQPQSRWEKPTGELASDLLPPDLAADAVSHRFGAPITQGGEPTSVRFVGRGRDSGDGFCVGKSYYVSMLHRPEGAEPQSPVSGNEVRLGGCEGIFAHVNPDASPEDGKRVLRWLKWAVQTAKSEPPLPFAIGCSDEMPYDEDRCASGARAALAALPLDKVAIITRDNDPRAHRWTISVTETRLGDTYWQLKVDGTPGKSSIDLVWGIPAPF